MSPRSQLGFRRPQSADEWLEWNEPWNGIQDRGAFIPASPGTCGTTSGKLLTCPHLSPLIYQMELSIRGF